MNNKILSFVALALTLALSGCMHGQSAENKLNPNQVRAIPGANGTTEYPLILPIKGKPYDSATQWIFDQIVAEQAGGDIKSITVDPASVQVTFSEQQFGEGLFIVIGKAHVTLTQGRSMDAFFREPFQGSCQEDRVFANYSSYYMPETTAFREGLASWASAANSSDQVEALEAQLSIAMLVKEITADGTVNPKSLEDWKAANQVAWSKRKVLGLE
jgi:hypothetical protein